MLKLNFKSGKGKMIATEKKWQRMMYDRLITLETCMTDDFSKREPKGKAEEAAHGQSQTFVVLDTEKLF